MPYSDEELLEDICAVANVVERSPSLQDYRDHGEASVTTIYRRFDSWQDAVARAGFEPHEPVTRIPTADLIDALEELADELGASPSSVQMNKHGRYGQRVYRDRFGSWDEALEAAGLEPLEDDSLQPVSSSELRAELQRLAEEIGDTPTSRQMDEQGAYSSEAYRRHFGSWNSALEAIGHEPHHEFTPVSTDELLTDLDRLSEELNRRPTATDAIEHGVHGLATYQRRFGSWREAVEAAGFDSSTTQISDDELVEELHRLHDTLDKVPSIPDIQAEGQYSETPYKERFGSWSEALEAAGFDAERGPTDGELIAELRRLGDELDKRPSMRDMTDHGTYGCTTYQRRFGSWSTALEEAFEG